MKRLFDCHRLLRALVCALNVRYLSGGYSGDTARDEGRGRRSRLTLQVVTPASAGGSGVSRIPGAGGRGQGTGRTDEAPRRDAAALTVIVRLPAGPTRRLSPSLTGFLS